ncbi:molybdopterin-dependent oxidoreductase [Nocardiopsis changdeensis]|uniref:Molybdopterin-dependent oxidoreductase n=1 Tax=Nocardiopsis changdeensis TaxID=2831969 RepID=A0ABX8BP63_9ACTN|nr:MULTISPECIES: molybdopterin-dependent oxidoreductase [Nocardiopsis]QUX22852.1 molybdopterin-dependent oxidoreductase [Nocardiopsis changdeensis]QYX38794.1 molybdopterin-dependent oxidoreductase [Nocardiopsis sp. MT53]
MTDTPSSLPAVPAAVAGLVSAGAALAAAEAVGALVSRPAATPLQAVGAGVIDLVPLPLKQFAVDTFGTADKPVLLGGIAVLLACAAVLIGIASVRRRAAAIAGTALFTAAGLTAALTRPDAGPLDALPTLAGAAAFAAVLALLTRTPAPTGGDGRGGFDRRRFVLLAGTAAAASAAVAAGARLVPAGRGGLAPADVTLPVPGDRAAPLPDGIDLEIDGLAPHFTPAADFYRIDTALSVPRIDATAWSLRIHGLGVRDELVLTYDDLLGHPDLRERDITLACVSNPVGGGYIGNARWTGVPLASLLAQAGVRSPADGGPADQLVSRSEDGMTLGTPVADAMDGRDAMLAVGMNGRPLPREHGFPVRMVVPGLYGYVSACKWIVDIELTTFDSFDAYWVPRGWAARGPVKTQSRIDTPREGADLPPGPTTVAGVAWAQHTGIDRVEVSIDGGPWTEAGLAPEGTADTWRQWVLEWDAEPGGHRIAVRATDRAGRTQTPDQAPPAPDGATGHHTVTVTVA